MAVGPRKRVHRTRPTGQLARCLPTLTSIDAQAQLGEAGLRQAAARGKPARTCRAQPESATRSSRASAAFWVSILSTPRSCWP